MFQRDFILRQIQELIQVIARIVGLRIEGEYEEARTHIEKALLSVWDIHRETLSEFSAEQLLQLCIVNGSFHTEFAVALADLLIEDGHLYNKQLDADQAIRCFKQALIISELVLSESDAAPYDIYDRISRLEAYVSALQEKGAHVLEDE